MCLSSSMQHDFLSHLSCIRAAVYFPWNHYTQPHFFFVCLCWWWASVCTLTRGSVLRNSVPANLSPMELRPCLTGVGEVHLLLGLSATKRGRKKRAREFAGVELLVVLDAGFQKIYSLIKPSRHQVFFFCKSCLWDMSQWWHILKLFQWKESLSGKQPLVLWEVWPSMFLRPVGWILSSPQRDSEIFRVRAKVDFFPVRKCSQRPIWFFHSHADPPPCHSKALAVNGRLEHGANSATGGPSFRCCSYIRGFWKPSLRVVLCHEGRCLCKSKGTFLTPPFSSWQGYFPSSDPSSWAIKGDAIGPPWPHYRMGWKDPCG